MNADDFQISCQRTWNSKPEDLKQLCNAALGLAGEAGEVTELVKKRVFHNKPDPSDRSACETYTARVDEELGDVLYYVATLCSMHGLKLSDVMANNVAKLADRYPEGFTVIKVNAKGESNQALQVNPSHYIAAHEVCPVCNGSGWIQTGPCFCEAGLNQRA